MRLFPVLTLLLALAPAAQAGIDAALDRHVLPRTAAFAGATGALAATAEDDCTAAALRLEYQAAFDAWMGIAHLRLGPLEENGRALAIGFWPDKRGMVGDAVARLLAARDPAVGNPDDFAGVSVAARGLFALERLLYEPDLSDYGPDAYACVFSRAIARDLARMGTAIAREWSGGFAEAMRRPGKTGEAIFLNRREAAQALFTALVTGLEFNADQRLGRPMGSIDRPRPERAEARRSGRPLRNVILSLEALHELGQGLGDGAMPETDAAFATALETARELDDPLFADAGTPSGRLKLEILQQRIEAAADAARREIGPALGVSAGFNATDGD
ncbi:signal peptidase [Maritimibacter sp. 55A14]|uniref:imelysin family protein n=1 Tax=Maritimibacter sp. 55A14 TaxID=2174844 RepID=UPI000D617BA4|nr:imelysin family protein [Maritimibacter sp. 55A14]PWE28796.1 signal peptidase [Maritimibacter sp. 55A14]